MCAALLGLMLVCSTSGVQAAGATCGGQASPPASHACARGTVQPRIDVARTRNLEGGKAIEMAQRCHDLLRDDFGRFAQLACQLECDGRGQLAELKIGRRLDGQGVELQIVLGLQHTAQVRLKPLLHFQNHVAGPRWR